MYGEYNSLLSDDVRACLLHTVAGTACGRFVLCRMAVFGHSLSTCAVIPGSSGTPCATNSKNRRAIFNLCRCPGGLFRCCTKHAAMLDISSFHDTWSVNCYKRENTKCRSFVAFPPGQSVPWLVHDRFVYLAPTCTLQASAFIIISQGCRLLYWQQQAQHCGQ